MFPDFVGYLVIAAVVLFVMAVLPWTRKSIPAGAIIGVIGIFIGIYGWGVLIPVLTFASIGGASLMFIVVLAPAAMGKFHQMEQEPPAQVVGNVPSGDPDYVPQFCSGGDTGHEITRSEAGSLSLRKTSRFGQAWREAGGTDRDARNFARKIRKEQDRLA